MVCIDAPGGACHFRSEGIGILSLRGAVSPSDIVMVTGKGGLGAIRTVLSFKTCCQVLFSKGLPLSFPGSSIRLRPGYLTSAGGGRIFHCFARATRTIDLMARGKLGVLHLRCDGVSGIDSSAILTGCLSPRGDRAVSRDPSAVVCPFKLGRDRGATMRRTLSSGVDVVRNPPKANGARAVLGVVTGIIQSGGAITIISGGGSTARGVTRGLRGGNVSFLATFLKDLSGGRGFLTSRSNVCPGVRR